VQSVKALLDKNSNTIYFINTNNYTVHYYFARDILSYTKGHFYFNNTQYTENSERYLYPITINYYKDQDIFTYEFFPGDDCNCEIVEWAYKLLCKNVFFKDKLKFYLNNDSWQNCISIPTVTPNDIFKGQNYQALNTAYSYGYLRKVPLADLANYPLTSHDIVLTDGIPIDIPVVSGIITTDFQTPLSHINVLSHNRGTPNMALIDGFTNPIFDTLINKLIYFEVGSDSCYFRKATLNEANTFWNISEPNKVTVLEKDVTTNSIIDLSAQKITSVKTIGGKAANFAELIHASNLIDGVDIFPENNFAIPFYFYDQHLKKYGLDVFINNMLQNNEFINNQETRKELLQKLKDSIISSPIDASLLSKVFLELKKDSRYTSYKFRSSTNAEDLEGFNGAGLYSSFKGEIGDKDNPVDIAIKSVWASLWNYKAFEERSYYKIDHKSCAMGVLCHRSFPNEDANGVAITTNPYNENPAYVINVQVGDVSIVAPPKGTIHDQIVVYNYSMSDDEKYTIEYNSYSNLLKNSTEHVLSKEELNTLAGYIDIIKAYFYYNVYIDSSIPYKEFSLDIEFKVYSNSENKKIYIKQVRPY